MRLPALLAAMVLAGPASAQIRAVTLTPPSRDFGYFVGDLLTARAVIETGPDTTLDPRTLPAPGPVGPSVDLRDITILQQSTASGGQTTITATYQTFVSPEQVFHADIPGYTAGFLAGATHLAAPVPGFAYTVSPFRHDLQPVIDPAAIRPDHPPTPIDLSGPRRRLLIGAIAATLSALALAAGQGWRTILRRRPPPFAAAARQIARASNPEPDHLLALHRAFDATAGQRVFADDLDAFFARHPHFAALRQDIDRFFNASRATFFTQTNAAQDTPPLANLSRALARAERRA